MIIAYHRDFKKRYKKLSPRVQAKLEDRIRLFSGDEFDPILNNHALKGKYSGFRTINVTGDIRAIFRRDAESALFVAIDNHSNLYG